MNLPEKGSKADVREGTVCILSEVWKDELNEDLLLPDSMPDVKKILSVTFDPAVREKVCEEGGYRYGGECPITLLYMSDTNRLKKCTFSARFGHSESGKEGFAANTSLLLFPQITRSDCRMATPRKLSVRAELSVMAAAFVPVSLAGAVKGGETAEEALTVEYDEEERETVRLHTAEKTGLPFRTDLELESNLPGIGEIVDCRMIPRVTGLVFRQGECQVEGELTFLCLYETENNRFARVKKAYSLNEVLAFPEGTDKMHGVAVIRAEELRASVQNNSYGERRVIEIDAVLSVMVHAAEPTTAKVTRDLFSTFCEVKKEEMQVGLCVASPALSSSCSVNIAAARKENGAEKAGLPFDGSVLLTEFAARYDAEKKKVIAEGSVEATICAELTVGEEEGRDFVSVRASQPFRCEIDTRGFEPDRLLVLPCVTPPVFRADENSLYADSEVCVTVLPMKEEDCTCVRTASLDPSKPWETSSEASLLLYYPDSGDTVWEIAKHYHIPPSSLAAANGLTEGKPDKKVLRIPCGSDTAASFTGIL